MFSYIKLNDVTIFMKQYDTAGFDYPGVLGLK